MNSSNAIDQKELLIRLQKGNDTAFEKVYVVHKKNLAGRLYSLLKSWDLVEDRSKGPDQMDRPSMKG